MSWFILQILPYVSVFIFLLGLCFRLMRWAGARIVHNITLSPFSQNHRQMAGVLTKEIVFFRSLFQSDRAQWAGGWLMHAALFLVLGGHLVGIYCLGRQFVYLGFSVQTSQQLSAWLGIALGLLVMVALFYLLVRRLMVIPLKLITGAADFFYLVLLLTIVVIGNLMRLYEDTLGIPYSFVKDYVAHLISFRLLPSHHEVFARPFFVLHLLFVQILLLVFPFSKLLHAPGMFYQRWVINRVFRGPRPGLPGLKDTRVNKAGGGSLNQGGDNNAKI